MEAARIEAFYAALKHRPSSQRSDGEGSYHGGVAVDEEYGHQVLTEADMFGKGGSKRSADGSLHGGANDGSMHGSSTRGEGSRSGNTMEEEVGLAFANLEGAAEFDPARLGMNVSKDASGGLVVTVPPKGARRAPGEAGESSRGGNAYASQGGGSAHGEMVPFGGARMSSNGSNSSVENSRHGPSDLSDVRAQLARQMQRKVPDAADVPPAASPGRGPAPKPPSSAVLSPSVLAATQAAAAAAAQRDRRSFVARLRDPETGALSNLRLFGGNVGASTAMTRSIGDAGAARCCIAEPEFCTLLVAPTQRARLIIASDGMWDVYANEEAEQLSRGTRMDAPKTTAECATLLVTRALEDRTFDGLSADDITAVVVDIRGGGLASAGGPSGACCVVM